MPNNLLFQHIIQGKITIVNTLSKPSTFPETQGLTFIEKYYTRELKHFEQGVLLSRKQKNNRFPPAKG